MELLASTWTMPEFEAKHDLEWDQRLPQVFLFHLRVHSDRYYTRRYLVAEVNVGDPRQEVLLRVAAGLSNALDGVMKGVGSSFAVKS